MTTRNLLFTAVHFLLTVALFAAGGFFIALGTMSHVRHYVMDALTSHTDMFLLAGSLIVFVAALFVYAFYHLSKGFYFHLKMESVKNAQVDPKLVAQLVQRYFISAFPETKIAVQVLIHKGERIEVVAELANPSQELLEKVEKELSDVFASVLKYHYPFILTVGSHDFGKMVPLRKT